MGGKTPLLRRKMPSPGRHSPAKHVAASRVPQATLAPSSPEERGVRTFHNNGVPQGSPPGGTHAQPLKIGERVTYATGHVEYVR